MSSLWGDYLLQTAVTQTRQGLHTYTHTHKHTHIDKQTYTDTKTHTDSRSYRVSTVCISIDSQSKKKVTGV